MLIVTAAAPRQVRLSSSFLAEYYRQGDPFRSLLSRSVYLTKYCRDAETWTDTIRRVVEANVSLAPEVTIREAEMLFHLFWTGQALPPGRGLWTGGVTGIPADARYNCWFTSIRSTEDWCWTANQLMLGGGVGVGLTDLGGLPPVAGGEARFALWCTDGHPNVSEVGPDPKSYLNGQTPIFRVPDSREGWVEALRRVLRAAWEAKDLIVDLSEVRERGAPIKTFGGVACGPGPLGQLLRAAWGIVRGAAGRRLRTIEALDITNYVGRCIKAGNVRRSALIALGNAEDREFRDAKKDWDKVVSHRHTSNNSIAFQSEEQIADFDWLELAMDNVQFGEPGLINLPLIWKTDPGVRGINPCGEIPLHDREACNLAEVFPAFFHETTDPATVLKLITRYSLRQRMTPLVDEEAESIRTKNMRVGVGLGGLCDFAWTPDLLSSWYDVVRGEADSYAAQLGVARPIAVTTVKPSGTISLLNESSPGVHAPYAPFYIRRTRIATNDPLAGAMVEAGVPYEPCIYDTTGHTYVFSFPARAQNTRFTVQTESLRDQFERQRIVQKHWADNSVSATLSFDKTRPEELAALLKEYVPSFKSTSCLARGHSYQQAPYEAVSEEAYWNLYEKIDHTHSLVRGGDIEADECQGGACPIR